MDYIGSVSGGVYPYDTRIFGYDWLPKKDAVSAYLATSGKVDEIYKALHIESSTKKPVFEMNSGTVSAAYESTNLEDYSKYYNFLIDNDYPLIVMAGEFDM